VVGVREVPPDVGGEVTEMTRAFGDRGIAGPTATAQAPAARGSRGPRVWQKKCHSRVRTLALRGVGVVAEWAVKGLLHPPQSRTRCEAHEAPAWLDRAKRDREAPARSMWSVRLSGAFILRVHKTRAQRGGRCSVDGKRTTLAEQPPTAVHAPGRATAVHAPGRAGRALVLPVIRSMRCSYE
jgi:hypothetical protein